MTVRARRQPSKRAGSSAEAVALPCARGAVGRLRPVSRGRCRRALVLRAAGRVPRRRAPRRRAGAGRTCPVARAMLSAASAVSRASGFRPRPCRMPSARGRRPRARPRRAAAPARCALPASARPRRWTPRRRSGPAGGAGPCLDEGREQGAPWVDLRADASGSIASDAPLRSDCPPIPDASRPMRASQGSPLRSAISIASANCRSAPTSPASSEAQQPLPPRRPPGTAPAPHAGSPPSAPAEPPPPRPPQAAAARASITWGTERWSA